MQNDNTQYLDILQKKFGFSAFRPGQLEAITSLMTQGRLLCIQPTGHGKSLLYQLPAVLLDGITLVISPLLALMRDQLAQLKNRFGIAAASINTDQLSEENFAAKQAALAGKIRILFIAPEQLENNDKFEFLLNLPIKLMVVDEAHCISTWGHDFRPSYRQIIQLARALSKKYSDLKLLALTATANKKTEQDIKQQLSVDQTKIIVHRESMNRPNIRLSVISVHNIAEKLSVLSELLHSLTGSGLIYCATRENTELVAEYLSGQGIITTAYHAGIESHKKQIIQTDFIQDKYQVISATNALGMGIDKPNLRYIIHFDFPGSITAYYQEVGRAGRDGLAADGILLYNPADRNIQRYFIDAAQPNATDFHLVQNTVISSKISLNLSALKRLTGLHPTRLTVILAELIEQSFLKKISLNGAQIYQALPKTNLPDLSRYITQLTVRNSELSSMQHYAEQSKQCLMSTLRHTLGDEQVNNCDKCSVCKKSSFPEIKNNDLLVTITSWLEHRTPPIVLSKKITQTAAGMATLDGKLRSPLFAHFMRERTNPETNIDDTLLQHIKTCLQELTRHHQIGSIISLPSRTWSNRENFIGILAKHLKIPAYFDVLNWMELPSARQGELLNNDQRQYNVTNKMSCSNQKVPIGSILLVDDYVGSGATLNEAARALRELPQMNNTIIPFTIAAVKWRMGKQGMI